MPGLLAELQKCATVQTLTIRRELLWPPLLGLVLLLPLGLRRVHRCRRTRLGILLLLLRWVILVLLSVL
jgi:hypothetical protein